LSSDKKVGKLNAHVVWQYWTKEHRKRFTLATTRIIQRKMYIYVESIH
jgi:hypothetical protein